MAYSPLVLALRAHHRTRIRATVTTTASSRRSAPGTTGTARVAARDTVTEARLAIALARAGGIGIVQPISLTYVHRHDFREGLRLIRRLTPRPIGMNALIEQSSRAYRERMERWVTIALEEGVRFFITSLGNPRWVVTRVHPAGGVVYHDVTERKWALKGLDGGVDVRHMEEAS